jgi:acyl carrier protein
MKTKQELLDEAYSKMEEFSEGIVDKSNLSPETIILDSGLDSLGYAHVMLSLEEFTGRSVQEDDINWADVKTIDQLVCLFL